jgi:hypothetical protein
MQQLEVKLFVALTKPGRRCPILVAVLFIILMSMFWPCVYWLKPSLGETFSYCKDIQNQLREEDFRDDFFLSVTGGWGNLALNLSAVHFWSWTSVAVSCLCFLLTTQKHAGLELAGQSQKFSCSCLLTL